MKAVLLAAGEGKRLGDLTQNIPKPMIKIAGKPIIEYIVEDLSDSGFNDICIVIGHEGKKIKDYFLKNKFSKINFTFVTQNEFLGTAHAVNCAKEFVAQDEFLLYLSDTILPFDLQNVLFSMIHDKHDISILTSNIFSNSSSSVGNISLRGNFVQKISEKSKNPQSNLAWAGVAFFKNNSIFETIRNLQLSKHGEYDITMAMNDALSNEKIIRNFYCEKFIDCGTIRGLLDGLPYILKKRQNVFASENRFHNNSPTYVGRNCSFGKNVSIGPFTSLGDNVIIGDNVQITKSLIFDNTEISSNNIISDSIMSPESQLYDENIL